MRSFNRKVHKSIVLDDVRKLSFVTDHQHILQSCYDKGAITFASTVGGTCEYTKYLYAVPFIVTVNPSAENLEFLRSYLWLAQEENCVLLELESIAFEDPGSGVESGAE